MRQVLSYSFINVSAVERQGKRAKWEQKPRWLLHLLQSMEGALHLKWWKHTVATVVLIGESEERDRKTDVWTQTNVHQSGDYSKDSIRSSAEVENFEVSRVPTPPRV